MMEDVETVVITGGSSGIGNSFIHQLHKLNNMIGICNLSRQKPCINSTISHIYHIPCDLGIRDQLESAADQALEFLRGRQGKIMLINNSGFGSCGPFPEPGLDRNLEMIDLNVRAVVHLTGLLLPVIKERGGAIINVASTAAYQATPYMITYGATKAFLLNWSLGLGEELRKHGVHVMALCPGPTSTRFFKSAGFDEPILSPRIGHTPEQVVDIALRALRRRKKVVVCGWMNKVVTGASSLMPKVFTAALSEKVLRRFRLERRPGT